MPACDKHDWHVIESSGRPIGLGCPKCTTYQRLAEAAPAPTEHDRTYVVGLPVVLTVHLDGSVSARLDLSEADELDDASTPDGQQTRWEDTDRQAIAEAVSGQTIVVVGDFPLPPLERVEPNPCANGLGCGEVHGAGQDCP